MRESATASRSSEVDCVDDARVYGQQERNGMWMRVAPLARLFGVDDAILPR